LSYVDWANPLELVAIGGDIGRASDREVFKELLGYTVTFSDNNGTPVRSFTFDPDRELLSVADWTEGETLDVIAGDDFLKQLDGDPLNGG
jgi:hypothetical protein